MCFILVNFLFKKEKKDVKMSQKHGKNSLRIKTCKACAVIINNSQIVRTTIKCKIALIRELKRSRGSKKDKDVFKMKVIVLEGMH